MAEEKNVIAAVAETLANAVHPVNRWTRKCGVDHNSISFLFDGVYR